MTCWVEIHSVYKLIVLNLYLCSFDRYALFDIVNECVAKQHRMVVCKMALMVKKKKAEKVKPKIRWWKLKETSYQEAFRQEVTRILGSKDGLPDGWDKTAEMLSKTAETVKSDI